MAIGLAIASLVVAAGSAYEQNRNAAAARAQQRKAAAVSAAQNAASQSQQIRQQVRQQRVRTAQIIQASANTGTLASSGELGGVSALTSQTGNNVATLTQSGYSRQGILSDENAAAGYQGQAATWGAVGQLASSSFNIFASTPQFRQGVAGLMTPKAQGVNPEANIYGI